MRVIQIKVIGMKSMRPVVVLAKPAPSKRSLWIVIELNKSIRVLSPIYDLNKNALF